MKQTVKTALDGIWDAVQRLDEPIDPEAEAMELTPAMISSPRKIAPADDDAHPTGTALEQEVAARMAEVVETPPTPAADRDAPLSDILKDMKDGPPPSPAPSPLLAQDKPAPAFPPADYGREFYLQQVFGLVGVALLKVAEPDYGVSTGRAVADQLVMTYTIIRQLEGRVEEMVEKTANPAYTVLPDQMPVPSDVVNLADQAALNLARQCLAAERQIRDRLQEIERKLER